MWDAIVGEGVRLLQFEAGAKAEVCGTTVKNQLTVLEPKGEARRSTMHRGGQLRPFGL